MYRPKGSQERIEHRLKIALGHLQRVLQMVESGDYCIDVINQSRAVQSALKEVDSLLLENHLRTCVIDHIEHGKADTAVEEVMRVFKSNK